MSYTATIKDNDSGEILEHETNVEVIMGAKVIRHNELSCHSETFVHSGNRILCGHAWFGIKELHEDMIASLREIDECEKDEIQAKNEIIDKLMSMLKSYQTILKQVINGEIEPDHASVKGLCEMNLNFFDSKNSNDEDDKPSHFSL